MTALILFRSQLPGPASLVPLVAMAWLICAGVLWRAFSLPRGALAFGITVAIVCGLRLAAGLGEALYFDHYREDREFLEQACRLVPADRAILVNGDDGPLCASWWLNYGRGRTQLLHNLTFLRDERLDPHEVYLISRRRFESELSGYRTAEVLDESRHSKHEEEPLDRYAVSTALPAGSHAALGERVHLADAGHHPRSRALPELREAIVTGSGTVSRA